MHRLFHNKTFDPNDPSTDLCVTVRTIIRWLHRLGMSYGDVRKGVYKDGHEREDVVDDRQHRFLPLLLKDLWPTVRESMRDGWYIKLQLVDDSWQAPQPPAPDSFFMQAGPQKYYCRQVKQQMQQADGVTARGLRHVLMERGLWPAAGLKRQCDPQYRVSELQKCVARGKCCCAAATMYGGL
jgi:hypothetical protein